MAYVEVTLCEDNLHKSARLAGQEFTALVFSRLEKSRLYQGKMVFITKLYLCWKNVYKTFLKGCIAFGLGAFGKKAFYEMNIVGQMF